MGERGVRAVWLAAMAGVVAAGCVHTPEIVHLPPPPGTPPTEEAAQAFASATEVFTRHDEAGIWDGEACREALAGFEDANARLGGADARAAYMSGLVASRCGNAEGARAFFTRSSELDPALCEPRVSIALAHMDAGRRAEARAELERAIVADSRCAPAYVNLAILQSAEPRERDAAVANVRRALASRSDYLPAFDRLAQLYLDMASERPELLDLAAVVCRQAQLVDADYAPIYNTWALIDVARGDITGAVAKLSRARALDPELFSAHMNFGQLTLSQRAYADAAEAFAQARALRPDDYDAALGLGVAMRGQREPEEAERLYRAALELDDARPEAWFDLAVLYQEHRDGTVEQLSQAERFLGEFVSRAQRQGAFSETVGEVLRWCSDAPASRRGRARAASCQRGRAQVIYETLVLLGEESHARPAWTR